MHGLSKYDKILVLIFILLLPLINPWVRGDGVGYYAFGRALLIEHDLNFEKDWLAGNTSFRMGRADEEGHIYPEQYTSTGHLDNHFSVGPAILWSPFLVAAHLGVLGYDALGGHVPADGYSRPYIIAISLGTALYGFLAVLISFHVARKYLPERWAFLGTLGIWFASSLPVYMYFNPSWSHAHSAFAVALFFWYWDRTRHARTLGQWVLLGALAGLMMNVYYLNTILLLLPLLESISIYRRAIESREAASVRGLFLRNVIFAAMVLAAFMPTLITKKIIFGSYFNFGYTESWYPNSPALWKVCFSAEHGLFSWTPILVLSCIGFFFLCRTDRVLGLYSIAVSAAYLYAIGCYQNWAGVSSFGNRFFISLTILFVLGLTAFFDFLARTSQERRAAIISSTATAVLILWNMGLIFQWGTHLIPARGPISWREAAYNQYAVVPAQVVRTLKAYLTRRKQLMGNLEEEDLKQLKSRKPDKSN